MQKEDFGTKVNPQSISAPTLSLEVCPSPLPASPPLPPLYSQDTPQLWAGA